MKMSLQQFRIGELAEHLNIEKFVLMDQGFRLDEGYFICYYFKIV